MQITDAQVHLCTGGKAPERHFRAPFSVEKALHGMDEAGIAGAVNHPPDWDPDAMDYAAAAAAAHPDRFATLGWFPLDETTTAESVETTMRRPGMLGLRFILPRPEIMALLTSGKLEWLWAEANARELPMGLFIVPQQVPMIAGIAARYPRMRLLIDHLGVLPFVTLPDAAATVEAVLDLACLPNVAVKATGIPSMATDDYPFSSTHALLRSGFDAFGAERMFWGTDITRMQPSWRACADMFVRELDWLTGVERDAVMGKGIRDWIGWN